MLVEIERLRRACLSDGSVYEGIWVSLNEIVRTVVLLVVLGWDLSRNWFRQCDSLYFQLASLLIEASGEKTKDEGTSDRSDDKR